ncbi:hypothetical protein BGP_2276 [Beggiatoa sp. PS]|nr:hypothetical protein BGP_2276 [Beggiatoa sp. PS]
MRNISQIILFKFASFKMTTIFFHLILANYPLPITHSPFPITHSQ